MWCYACKKYKFLLSKGLSIGSSLLFVCGATHVKSITSSAEYRTADREPLTFCMRCYAYKKHKFLLSKGPPIRSPLLFVCGDTHVKRISFY
jgi:hypothetical protein